MFLKVMEQEKNLLRNFQINGADCGDWTNFWKSHEKLAWLKRQQWTTQCVNGQQH